MFSVNLLHISYFSDISNCYHFVLSVPELIVPYCFYIPFKHQLHNKLIHFQNIGYTVLHNAYNISHVEFRVCKPMYLFYCSGSQTSLWLLARASGVPEMERIQYRGLSGGTQGEVWEPPFCFSQNVSLHIASLLGQDVFIWSLLVFQ